MKVYLMVSTTRVGDVVETNFRAFSSRENARVALAEVKEEYTEIIDSDEDYFSAVGDDSGYETDVSYNIEEVELED